MLIENVFKYNAISGGNGGSVVVVVLVEVLVLVVVLVEVLVLVVVLVMVGRVQKSITTPYDSPTDV